MSDTATADLLQRCAIADEILSALQARLGRGDPAAELLTQLQAIWQDAPAVADVPPTVGRAIARTQDGIAAAVAAAETWLTSTEDQLHHLARGRQMSRAYTSFES